MRAGDQRECDQSAAGESSGQIAVSIGSSEPTLGAAPCEIRSVGGRRGGGKRYWCYVHRADATAKYGHRAAACRLARVPAITEDDAVELRIDDYPGGVALWGAVAPVYDTTLRSLERGIHVHTRTTAAGSKIVDRTVRAVRVLGGELPAGGFVVTGLDAIYYMVSTVFGFATKSIACSHCRFPHLDQDWFSVHPHRRHLCAGCGRFFRDDELGIGNPTQTLRATLGRTEHTTTPARLTVDIRQADYPGGVQIWGSNPALLWTSPSSEEAGIHVHAFRTDSCECPEIDDTFSRVMIDGASLDANMVRVAMAQSALPHLRGRIRAANCPDCHAPQFCVGESGFTPRPKHRCGACRREFAPRERLRRTVLNPLPAVLARLTEGAPRRPQRHDMGLTREAPQKAR